MSGVTRAVRLLSTLHASKTQIQNGKTSIDDIAKSTIFSPQHFPKFLSVSMVLSGYAGWTLMDNIRASNNKNRTSYYEVSVNVPKQTSIAST